MKGQLMVSLMVQPYSFNIGAGYAKMECIAPLLSQQHLQMSVVFKAIDVCASWLLVKRPQKENHWDVLLAFGRRGWMCK